MKKEEIYKKILKCADENGVIVLVGDEQPEDLDIAKNFEDSLQFMSFILALEEELDVEIPDEYLIYESLQSIAAFSQALEELTEK